MESTRAKVQRLASRGDADGIDGSSRRRHVEDDARFAERGGRVRLHGQCHAAERERRTPLRLPRRWNARRDGDVGQHSLREIRPLRLSRKRPLATQVRARHRHSWRRDARVAHRWLWVGRQRDGDGRGRVRRRAELSPLHGSFRRFAHRARLGEVQWRTRWHQRDSGRQHRPPPRDLHMGGRGTRRVVFGRGLVATGKRRVRRVASGRFGCERGDRLHRDDHDLRRG